MPSNDSRNTNNSFGTARSEDKTTELATNETRQKARDSIKEKILSASFSATIDYAKLAITSAATLGCGAALALCTLIGTLISKGPSPFQMDLDWVRYAAIAFAAAAALPALCAACSYLSQSFYFHSQMGNHDGNINKGHFWRYAAIACLIFGVAAFIFGFTAIVFFALPDEVPVAPVR